MVLLGHGAKAEGTGVRAGSSRAGEACSLHALTFQRGITGIWFEVCRSGFHYTTVLVAAAHVRSRPRWMLLAWWAPFLGNYSLR